MFSQAKMRIVLNSEIPRITHGMLTMLALAGATVWLLRHFFPAKGQHLCLSTPGKPQFLQHTSSNSWSLQNISVIIMVTLQLPLTLLENTWKQGNCSLSILSLC